MSTATLVRPLPINTILPVKGTSFRQEQVHRVVEMDELRIRHDTLNEHDPNACVVETLTGEQLGFIAKELAGRLAGPHPGGRWRARVEEVLRGETWGLRIRLGPLAVEGIYPTPGHDVPGLRHSGDGVAETDGVVVTTDPVEEVPSPAETAPAEPATERVVQVHTKTGRLLGTFLGHVDGRVEVKSPNGSTTLYPAAVVRIGGGA